ncbi:hypothetical protein LIA77_03071 [Sarocladium implicatum]|nr:hypothetical protein LIA77_03071 [Sarocladium implicatum]
MATSTASSRAPTETPTTVTPSMRDRQARGRDPYSIATDHVGEDDDDEMGVIIEQGQRVRKHHETWEQKEKTGFATRILSNPDLLLWHAQAKGDSVTGQRLRFTAMLCGYDEDHEVKGRSGSGGGGGTGGSGAGASSSGGRR